MKNFFYLILLSLLVFQVNANENDTNLSITVLNQDYEPVKGICIYYKLESYRDRNIFGLPIEPAEISVVRFEKYITNNYGIIIIPLKKISLKQSERLVCETVIVNLDLKEKDKLILHSKNITYFDFPEWYSTDRERNKLINPYNNYKGMIIYNIAEKNAFIYPDNIKYSSASIYVKNFFESRDQNIILVKK